MIEKRARWWKMGLQVESRARHTALAMLSSLTQGHLLSGKLWSHSHTEKMHDPWTLSVCAHWKEHT